MLLSVVWQAASALAGSNVKIAGRDVMATWKVQISKSRLRTELTSRASGADWTRVHPSAAHLLHRGCVLLVEPALQCPVLLLHAICLGLFH